MPQTITPLSYTHTTGTSLKTIIVSSIIKDETTDAGIFIPEDVANYCERGIVLYADTTSVIVPGDQVLYRKVDRRSTELENTVEIDGKICDVLFENEVWAINNKPFNRLFVQILNESVVTESNFILTDSTEGVPQRAIVFDAPQGSFFKKNDILEFRKENKKAIYPTIEIDGLRCEVLYEKDVFTVNDKVSPHRIIVSIDIPAQKLKRETTDSGFVRSPLFIAMLYNLQYGKVIDIGEEAQKMYPELNIGDTAILHHTIEAQPYRLLKQVSGKHVNVVEEHRIINCFDLNAREIFGKIERRKVYGKIADNKIVPFHKNVFLEYKFSVYEAKRSFVSDVIVDVETDIDKCTEIDDLKIMLNHKKQAAVQKYQSKFQGYISDIERLEPEDHDKRNHYDARIQQLKRDATDAAKYYSKNHYLKCKIVFPKQLPNEVLVTYKELYPINILGKKYLIAHNDFIIAKLSQNNMGKTIIHPIANRVFVRPLEENNSPFYIPDGSKEKPQKGIIVAIGDLVENVKVDDTVLYKRLAGTEITVDEEELLMMNRNDLFAVVEEEKDLVARVGYTG